MTNVTEKDIDQLAREKRNAYQREYRKNNPEKVKSYETNYWRRKATKQLKENSAK